MSTENGVSMDVVYIDNDQPFTRLHTTDKPDVKIHETKGNV